MDSLFFEKTVWKCRHCGNTYTVENQPGKPLKQPAFCDCRKRDFELDLEASRQYLTQVENQENPLFQQGRLNLFVDYIKLAEIFQQEQPYFYDQNRIWWLWNKQSHCWKRIDETDILNAIDNAILGLFVFKNKTKTEIMNALKMQGRRKNPKPMNKKWIQCGKKIYDLNGLMFDAGPEWFTTNPIPWDLTENQETETPNIDKLFKEWVTPEYVELLYEICAYCMVSDYPIRRVFCLNGEGANGKSTYLKIVENLVGQENICTANFALLNSRFESSKLYKKLVCEMHEISHKELRDTSTFKKLTGGDMIRFEFKGKDGFDDYSYAKLVISTNKLPESPDKSKGYFDRWCIIDFKNTFQENPSLLECISEEEYRCLARKCLRIAIKLVNTGRFTMEGEPDERRTRYEERASPFNDFFKGYLYDRERDWELPVWALREDYDAYLAERGYRKVSKYEIVKLLRNRGIEIYLKHVEKEDGTKTTQRYAKGISRRF